MSKRVIILGKSGFIGGWLFKRFSEDKSFKVKGFSSQECNLLSLDSTEHALSDLKRDDIVIMAAAVTRTKENTFAAFLKNIQMAETVSRVLHDCPVRQLVYLSSIDVYGSLEKKFNIQKKRISECGKPNPDDYYAMAKVTSEFLLQSQLTKNHTALSILRLPGVYGPGDGGQSLIGQFIRSMTQEGKVSIFGDGGDRRDYLYVDDVYRIVKEAIRIRFDGILNAVSTKSTSVLEIAQLIKFLSGCECAITFEPVKDKENERIKNMRVSNSLLQRTFPDFRFRELAQGISVYLKFFSTQKIVTV